MPEGNYNVSLSEWSPYLPDTPLASVIGSCSSVYGVPKPVSRSSYISLEEVSATGILSAMTSSYVSVGTASTLPALSSVFTSLTTDSPLHATGVTTLTSFSTTTVQLTTYVSVTTSSSTVVTASSSHTISKPYPGFVGAPGALLGVSNSTANGSTIFSNCKIPCNDVPDGAVLCMNSTHFGICNFGFAVPLVLAAGTICSNGTITRRSLRAVA